MNDRKQYTDVADMMDDIAPDVADELRRERRRPLVWLRHKWLVWSMVIRSRAITAWGWLRANEQITLSSAARQEAILSEANNITGLSSAATDLFSAARAEQVGGSHYRDMVIQPVEFIHANQIGFIEGSVIKYVCRHRAKNGRQDLEKAIHFLQLLIGLEYGET